MKKRVYSTMDNGVYRVDVYTEDWSHGDVDLMMQFGEPEIEMAGEFEYTYNEEKRSKDLGNELARVMHGFPYSRVFDSRDYDGKVDEAVEAGRAWKEKILARIDFAIKELRDKSSPLPTEEVYEI